MSVTGVRLLTRSDVDALIDLPSCVEAVQAAFEHQGQGAVFPQGAAQAQTARGEYHVKAGGVRGPSPRYAVKVNARFPFGERPGRVGVRGVILLSDAADGTRLAILDSRSVTAMRTAAASVVAARLLAPPGSRTAAVIGTGAVGRAHVQALPLAGDFERVLVWGRDPAGAQATADAARCSGAVAVAAVDSPVAAARAADVIITATPARAPLLDLPDVRPGAFVAAVGADSPGKQELTSPLVGGSAVVTDLLDQCAAVGELAHALADGTMSRDDVRGELGDVLCGRVAGRSVPDERVLFDATGAAFADAAVATAVYERAVRDDVGTVFDFDR